MKLLCNYCVPSLLLTTNSNSCGCMDADAQLHHLTTVVSSNCSICHREWELCTELHDFNWEFRISKFHWFFFDFSSNFQFCQNKNCLQFPDFCSILCKDPRFLVCLRSPPLKRKNLKLTRNAPGSRLNHLLWTEINPSV